MIKFQQSHALTSHFESFWNIVGEPLQVLKLRIFASFTNEYNVKKRLTSNMPRHCHLSYMTPFLKKTCDWSPVRRVAPLDIGQIDMPAFTFLL